MYCSLPFQEKKAFFEWLARRSPLFAISPTSRREENFASVPLALLPVIDDIIPAIPEFTYGKESGANFSARPGNEFGRQGGERKSGEAGAKERLLRRQPTLPIRLFLLFGNERGKR